MQKIKRTGNPLSKRFPALHSVPVGAEQASTGRLAPLPRVDATGFEPDRTHFPHFTPDTLDDWIPSQLPFYNILHQSFSSFKRRKSGRLLLACFDKYSYILTVGTIF